jgi:16S rRNA (cytosine967-C5)-methyltransferase
MPDNKFIHLIIPLVRKLLEFESPTDKLLSNFFRENKKLTSLERSLVADTVYTILRNYYKLNVALPEHIPNIIGLTWLKLLNIAPSIVAKINMLDINYLNSIEFKHDQTSTLELPEWIIKQLQLNYTDTEIEKLALSMGQAAALDLRVNLVKNNLNTVLSSLSEFNPQKMEFSPFGIRLKDKAFLAKHPLFLDGSIEVQDESSQVAGLLLNPKRGDMVVDFCAGAGGKTLLFGMLMRNSGRIYAFDVNEKRLNNLSPRMIRAGLSNVYPQLIAHENDAKIKRLHNKIDRVFVDAPCSGLGTLRRNPELKFRQTEIGINELNRKQEAILEQASKLLKVGGHLVYATCSILYQENQNIVKQFLHNHPEFELIPASSVLTSPHLARDNIYLELLPHIHNTDGFFAALLRRVS